MKKSLKWLVPVILFLAAAAVAVILLLPKNLDVVGTQSIRSFEAVLEASGGRVTPDETNGGWSLWAPDGSARFIWSRDFSKSPARDVMVEVDAQPFLDAGLDPAKLPEGYALNDGRLTVGAKLGSDAFTYSGEATPLSSYEKLVAKYRDAVGYHAALDHYGVNLGGGNMFEWARDMAKNDKDIVFVLSPEPFIAAGVNPEAVPGWVFAKVPVDVDGKPTQVDKLLKPFDLK